MNHARRITRALGAVVLGVLLLAVALFAIAILWPEQEIAPEPARSRWAIRDVTIVDVATGTTIPDQTIVIRGDRIEAVGRDLPLPHGTFTLDGSGRFVMPALWDMHTHVYAISPMLDLPLYIAWGVTNVRDMQGCPKPNDPFVACPEEKRRWSSEALSGLRVGPRIVASASWMANGPGMAERLGDVPEFFDTSTPEQARAFVRHFAPSADAIKVYDRLPRDAYFALVDEAGKMGVDVVGHRPRTVSAIEAAAHQKSLDHARFILHESFAGSAELRARPAGEWKEDRQRMIDEHDPDMARAIFEAMRESGTWYVPTHLTRWSDAWADDPRVREDPLLRYLHPLLRRQWQEDIDELLERDPSPAARETYRAFYRKGLELTGAAHAAGVKIMAGTDYVVPGADLHRELLQLEAAGLPAAAVLRAATISPAEYFGLENEFGTVASGRVADLLLLRANPLESIANTSEIEAVVFNGTLYDRTALDRIRSHVERRARSWTIGAKIIWRFVKSPAAY